MQPKTPDHARHDLPLTCHRGKPAGAITGITVAAVRSAAGGLHIRYELRGNVARIALPAPAAPRHTDNMWRHTCFEAFITTEDDPAYVECNFAPSGAWATYRFSRYRSGMTPVIPAEPPQVTLQTQAPVQPEPVEGHALVLEAKVKLVEFAGQPLRLGLSAVIEDTAGNLSYWALRHPRATPDFHHRGGFILRLA